MRPGEQRSDIRCPAGLFSRHEARIAQLTEAINRASTAREKAEPAEALRQEADALLQCEEYEAESVDCGLCQNLAELRRGAAALVIQAGAVEAHRSGAGDDRR